MSRKNTAKKGKGSQGFNRKNSEEFMLKNRAKAGVVQTASGLQYTIADQGEGGAKPTEHESVEVHQRIKLIDGNIVADSYKENWPEKFTMEESLAGYREGLQLMSVGDRYTFFVPHELAWGKRGAGSKIGPYATLIIDCRLISIN